jgi:hypothetical protein
MESWVHAVCSEERSVVRVEERIANGVLTHAAGLIQQSTWPVHASASPQALNYDFISVDLTGRPCPCACPCSASGLAGWRSASQSSSSSPVARAPPMQQWRGLSSTTTGLDLGLMGLDLDSGSFFYF